MALQTNYMIIREDCLGLTLKQNQYHVHNANGITESEFTTKYNYKKKTGTPSTTKMAIWGDYTLIPAGTISPTSLTFPSRNPKAKYIYSNYRATNVSTSDARWITATIITDGPYLPGKHPIKIIINTPFNSTLKRGYVYVTVQGKRLTCSITQEGGGGTIMQ